MSYHARRTIRLNKYDYCTSALYYITICTNRKDMIFGDIENGRIVLNEYGVIAQKELIKTSRIRTYVQLDTFIIMPDNIHSIIGIKNLRIDPCRGMACHAHVLQSTFVNRRFGNPIKRSLSSIIGAYKSSVSQEINKVRQTPGRTIWQRNYFEHVIRNERELYAARQYINNNPKNFEKSSKY